MRRNSGPDKEEDTEKRIRKVESKAWDTDNDGEMLRKLRRQNEKR